MLTLKAELAELLTPLRRFAYSLCGNKHDADDLLQATIERVLAKGVPADVPLVKWAFRVCRNLWFDEYRARKVRQLALHSVEFSEEAFVDGERDILNQIGVAEVDSAMRALPDEQREILALVAVQGLSYKEIADTLAVPLGTVMSRLSRARNRLLSLLQQTHRRTKP